MNRINRLLRKAKIVAGIAVDEVLPGDSDGFIEALGVDKGRYKVENIDKTIGYDFVKAMQSVAVDVWRSE